MKEKALLREKEQKFQAEADRQVAELDVDLQMPEHEHTTAVTKDSDSRKVQQTSIPMKLFGNE